MKIFANTLIFGLILTTTQLLPAIAQNDGYVCYYAARCAEMELRPIFVQGMSILDCCGQPNVASARHVHTEMCSECGPPTLIQVSPMYVALSPPSPLVLEISSTGYTAITWLLNGTDMHSFDRVQLENLSKQFRLSNTTESDVGTYEADVHTLNGTILTAYFIVKTFSVPAVHITVGEIDSQSRLVNFTCTSTGNPLPLITWQSSRENITESYGHIIEGTFSNPPSQVSILERQATTALETYNCTGNSVYGGITWTTTDSVLLNGEPPRLISSSGVVRVTEGMPEAVQLFCSAQGLPPPTIYWLRDGEELRNSSLVTILNNAFGDTANSTLTLEQVGSSDNGTHQCIARNPEGEISKDIELIVLTPPNVTAIHIRHLANIHQPSLQAVFICEAFGNPMPEIYWERGKMSQNVTCNNNEMGEAEMGEAEMGEAEMGEANVEPIPFNNDTSFETGGIDMTNDEIINEECTIITEPVSSTQTISTLTIYDLDYLKMNQTIFTCRGENGVENFIESPETDSVKLIVVSTPYFQVPLPRTHLVTIASTLILSCRVVGSGPPQVEWLVNQERLTNGGRVNITTIVIGNVTQSNLEIKLAKLSDGGVYTCQAEDEDGVSATDTTVIVRVPANITSPPQSTSAPENGTAFFRCTAHGIDLPLVSWGRIRDFNSELGLERTFTTYEASILRELFPFEYLSSVGNINIYINSTESNATAGNIISLLEIHNVSEDDSGTYFCEVTNMVRVVSPSNLTENIVEIATATLTLNALPQLIDVPTDATIPSTQTVQFRCSASGIPTPNIVWYREEMILTSMERVEITQYELDLSAVLSLIEVRNAIFEDAGLYRCRAINSAGYIDAPFYLTINTPPNITSPLPGAIITTQFPTINEVSLICSGTGSPTPQITWSRDNEIVRCTRHEVRREDSMFPSQFLNIDLSQRCMLIVSPGRTVLVIYTPVVEDSGQYTCKAENGVAPPDMVSIQLQVNVEPMAVIEKTNLDVEELSSFSIECKALNQPTPQISWLKDNALLVINETAELNQILTEEVIITSYYVLSTLTLERAIPGRDNGVYQCRINNANTSTVVFDFIDINIIEKDDCTVEELSPCQNSGFCLDDIDDYSCECTANFTGKNCTEPVFNGTQPVIVEEPEDIVADILTPVDITCRANGEPNPIYFWFKDGEYAFNTSEPIARFLKIRPSDRGLYNCIAMNSLGSSNASSSGLLTIEGVFQYLATFIQGSCSAEYDFLDLITQMSLCIAESQLFSGDSPIATIYSVSERPVPSGQSPMNQIVITVAAEGKTSDGIVQRLQKQLDTLEEKFDCIFTHLVRFDGCPEEEYILNQDFRVAVTWPESEIGETKLEVCPCGSLEADSYGSPQLTRSCVGTYSYGAAWGMVQEECFYNNNTFLLCNVTKFDLEKQAEALATATMDSSVFTALDFAIGGVIMKILANTDIITNTSEFQTGFIRSFNNLLVVNSSTVAESQLQFQSASTILDSLETFGQRIDSVRLASDGAILFTESRFQFQVEEIAIQTGAEKHSFEPNISSSAPEFQANATRTPLEGVTLNFPMELVDLLIDNNSNQTLRFLYTIMKTDTLFVINSTTQLGQKLDDNELTVGNLIIAASVVGAAKVEDLTESQSISINFTQTLGLNETNTTNPTCVFWDTSTRSVFGNWSTRGCELVSTKNGELVCRCNHLTHFGMLMDINPRRTENSITFSLQVITYIGCILSIACLMIVFATYLASKILRTKQVGKLLLHICLALAGVYASFLLAMHGKYYQQILGFCYTVSGLLQYFLLVYLFWTAIESFHICLKLVKIFGTDISNFFWKAAVIAWGTPFLIVVISAGFGVKYDMYAVKENGDVLFCRADKVVFYVGILVPFVLIYIFNLVVFSVIITSLLKQVYHKKKAMPDKELNTKHEYRKIAVIAFCLAIMFGLAWIFALLVPIPVEAISIASQYLFGIFIAIQGVLYFILHGIRAPEARKFWLRLIYRGCPSRMPEYLKPHISKSIPHYKVVSLPIRQNPIYTSEDNLFSNPAVSTEHGTLESNTQKVDLGASPSTYSLASQTLMVDFPVPAPPSDEDDTSSMDMQYLKDMINFSDPNEPGFAFSPPRMPHSLAFGTLSPLLTSMTALGVSQDKTDGIEYTLCEVNLSQETTDDKHQD